MTSIPLGAPVWAESLTNDLAADTAFYEGLFGWTSADSGEAFGHYTTFSLPGGEGREAMGLMPCPPGMAPSRTLSLHFGTADCDATAAKAKTLGAAVIAEPQDVADMLRFAMLLDPQGASFGLVEGKAPGTGFGAWGERNAVSWAEYHYDGVPAEAMRFYADLLGWEITTPPWADADDPKPYAALRAAGSEREFGGCHAAEGFELTLPYRWSVMIAVDDADDTCARARQLGGSVAGEPMDVPGLRIAGVAAPGGTVVGVMSDRPWA